MDNSLIDMYHVEYTMLERKLTNVRNIYNEVIVTDERYFTNEDDRDKFCYMIMMSTMRNNGRQFLDMVVKTVQRFPSHELVIWFLVLQLGLF